MSHLITGITCCRYDETVYGESIFRRRLQFSVYSGGKRKLHMQKNNQRDRGKPGQVLYYGNQSIKDFQKEKMINSINFG